jgi:uncharacterized protein
MRYTDAHTGLDLLDREECLELLAAREVGRIGIVVGGQPVVLPINYRVAPDGQIVFRTDPGMKLDAATRAKVALEIDELDPVHRTGWSVLVQGRGEEITEYDDRETRELSALPVEPWAGGEKAHWVRIVPSSITGRRLVAPG